MNIFIDCEFNEFEGELISMALVAEDGQEFYEVLDLGEYAVYGYWVQDNVLPYLNKDPIEKSVFQSKLWAFINQWKEVHIIADWPDDIKYFCQALITAPGIAINTPPNLTMQIDRSLSTETSKILHNALEDAKAIKESYNTWRKQQDSFGLLV